MNNFCQKVSHFVSFTVGHSIAFMKSNCVKIAKSIAYPMGCIDMKTDMFLPCCFPLYHLESVSDWGIFSVKLRLQEKMYKNMQAFRNWFEATREIKVAVAVPIIATFY